MESEPESRDTRSGGLTPLYEALALYLRRFSDAYLLEAILGLNRLVNAERLDVEAALSFLNTLPYPLDTEIGATIEHARTCVAAVPGGDHKHEAVACYAIKRIALVLERRLKDG